MGWRRTVICFLLLGLINIGVPSSGVVSSIQKNEKVNYLEKLEDCSELLNQISIEQERRLDILDKPKLRILVQEFQVTGVGLPKGALFPGVFPYRKVASFFESVSYGNLQIEWEKSKTLFTFDYQQPSSKEVNHRDFQSGIAVAEMFRSGPFKEVSAEDFDLIILISAANTSSQFLPSSIFLSWPDDKDIVLIGADYWEASHPWKIVSHEIGHALGLTDLYDTSIANQVVTGQARFGAQFRDLGQFDLMNNPFGRAPEFLVWNQLMLGWVRADEVACSSDSGLDERISGNHSNDAVKKAIFYPMSPDRWIFAEHRRADNFDEELRANEEGVLVYLVDLASGHQVSIRKLDLLNGKNENSKFVGFGIEVRILGESPRLARVRVKLLEEG
jgi:hypothetical protein